MKIVRIGAIWCPSCLVMRPRFEEVERKFKEIESVAYDIDFDEEAFKYDAGSILPVFILLNDKGEELERMVGEQKSEALIEVIERHLEGK